MDQSPDQIADELRKLLEDAANFAAGSERLLALAEAAGKMALANHTQLLSIKRQLNDLHLPE